MYILVDHHEFEKSAVCFSFHCPSVQSATYNHHLWHDAWPGPLGANDWRIDVIWLGNYEKHIKVPMKHYKFYEIGTYETL